jgi:acetyl-CoA carboxylase biotin carboxyl carrier protein
MDVDLVRHALTVARSRGFAEVELSSEDGAFSARLSPAPPSAKTQAMAAEVSEEPQMGEIRAQLVGYYRETKEPLAVGKAVKKGEVVAIIAALGIANDVESKVTGEVVEVLVAPNEPVQFGQPLAKVRLG